MYTRFQTKTAQKTLPDGAAHTYIAYIKEYPPARGKFLVRLKDNTACNGLIPGKSQSIGSKRKLKNVSYLLPPAKVWPDLEISEAFVIGLEASFSGDFTSRS